MVNRYASDMSIEQITALQVQEKQKQSPSSFVLLDCREAMELEIARIEGALHIPMGEIPTRIAELDRNREIIVVCHHGNRSMRVSMFLKQEGFEKVKNLAGGIDAWSTSVDPKVPRY